VGESGGFVVACFDDRGDVEGVADVDGGALAVSAVKADHPTCWGWGVGFELLRVECLAEEQEVGGVGGADHDCGGDTAAVYQEAAFGAVRGSVGGVGAGVGLLKGAFTIAVSSALGDHAIPRNWS